MAGWSVLANGSGLDRAGVSNKCQSNGCNVDVGRVIKGSSVEECGDPNDRLRCLFDLVLSGYLNDVASKGFIRPMPAMLGNDGESPDLLKLFLVVKEIGGYELVSEKGLWAFVVKELGLDLNVSASVKLIYAKYLRELEKWLRKSFGDGNRECAPAGDGEFGFLSLEQREEFRGLFTNGVGRKGVVNTVALLEFINNGKRIGKDIKNESEISDTNSTYRMRYSNDDEKDDLLVLGSAVYRKEYGYRKRKRESLSGMLNWVFQVARCHNDPSVAAILEPSKWKDHGGNEFWIQAIRAREALRLKRDDRSVTEQSLLLNNQKMHPSMYEDEFLSHHFTERSRCNETLPMPNSCSCSCCNSGSALHDNLICIHQTESGRCHKEQSHAEPYGDDSFRRQVAVGPRFQAEVPEWTGVVSDSDSKWLGKQEWPLTGGDQGSLAVTDPLGRGRPDSCGCWIPGSVECIRLHIAEKRMKLKLELGSVFYRWRFDGIGEEVSLRWTAEEEKRFKHMVQQGPSSLNAFWPDASMYFPRKTRPELVSYYFNVFVIRRRSYQNRVTPKSINSDDDESEFGCISDSFGNDAIKVPGSNMLKCTQNNQCIDWE